MLNKVNENVADLYLCDIDDKRDLDRWLFHYRLNQTRIWIFVGSKTEYKYPNTTPEITLECELGGFGIGLEYLPFDFVVDWLWKKRYSRLRTMAESR